MPVVFFTRFSLDDKSWEVVQPAVDSEVKTANSTHRRNSHSSQILTGKSRLS